MVPVLTVIGLQIGTIIAFSIITETVFQWPGMGLLFIHAVQTSDIPIMGCIFGICGPTVCYNQFYR